jgi:predicted porin
MKKLLLAATLALGVTVATAQSSVTVFGILDVGYTGSTTRSTTSAGTTKTNATQFGQSASTPSRLGFRGVEDLGGGTSALFMIDVQLYPEDARLSGPTQSGLVNRQTWVGLKQNGIGTGMIGTQFTPIFKQVLKTDPGGANDVVGSVIFPGSSYSGGVTTTAFTARTSNTLQFQSDTFNGFSGSVMYSAKNQDTTQTGANTGGNTNIGGYGISADYTWNKLYATVVHQKLTNENPTTTVTPVATAMTNDNGSNVNDSQNYAAVTYDFGILKAYAQYVSRTATSTLNSSQYLSRQAQQIGVKGNITSRVSAFANIGNGRYQAFGSGNPTANFIGWQAGTEYALSKRSALYGIVGSHQTSSTSSGSAGANQYAVGMRHTF